MVVWFFFIFFYYKKLLAKTVTSHMEKFLEVVVQAAQSPRAFPVPFPNQTFEEMTCSCITNMSLISGGCHG